MVDRYQIVFDPVSAYLHQCITDYHSSTPIPEEALKLRCGPHPVLSSPGHTRCPPVTSRWWCTGNDQVCILAPCIIFFMLHYISKDIRKTYLAKDCADFQHNTNDNMITKSRFKIEIQ